MVWNVLTIIAVALGLALMVFLFAPRVIRTLVLLASYMGAAIGDVFFNALADWFELIEVCKGDKKK